MSKAKDYIPLKVNEFFVWEGNLVSVMSPNAVAWLIPNSAVTALTNLQGPYETAYNKIKNTSTRTPTDTTEHKVAKKLYVSAIRKFVKSYLAFNTLVKDIDRSKMKITIPDTTPSARPKIGTAPEVQAKAGEGARIIVECRVEKDSSKPSMHPDADQIEIAYSVGTDILKPEDAPRTKVSKRAKATLALSIDDAGKKIYLFVRYINASDESKNGPWCVKIVKVIPD